MTKSQLIDVIAARTPAVPRRDVEAIVNAVFECMVEALASGERIEIRGFGSFAVKTRKAHEGRNPKTGEKVQVPDRRALSFTVGKELRERLNRGFAPAEAAAEEEAEVEADPEPAAPRSADAGRGVESGEGLAAAPPSGPRYTAG